MHDGIELEKQGVPTAVICTQPFVSSGRAMSTICGIPDYPFVVIPHPLGSLTPEKLKARAIGAVPDVLRILLGKE